MKLSKKELQKIIMNEIKDIIDEEALIEPGMMTVTGTGKLNIYHGGDNTSGHKKDQSSSSYMAKQQLDKISVYSKKVYDMICHGEQIDDWMESHIAQMADDIGEVYHKLNYSKKNHKK